MNQHQEFEAAWWGDCLNTYSEETKQSIYARHMGLTDISRSQHDRHPRYDLEGRSVLDIGGGPVSLLLKCENRGPCAVVDPCPYPEWTRRRYAAANITLFQQPAENFLARTFYSEAWIYNVLQHVENPFKVIMSAKQHASVIRIFEWVNMPPSLGHPHTLSADLLNQWIGGTGTVQAIDDSGATGDAYCGVFQL